MATAVTVLVLPDRAEHLPQVIASVDAQTLPTEQFEVVFVDRGLDQRQRDRLDLLTRRRPNVRVVSAADIGQTELAELVLLTRADQKLFPETLERLTGFARRHDLDVVAGRVVQPRHPAVWPFLADRHLIESTMRERALDSPVLLARREVLRIEAEDVRIDAESAKVGLLATYPAAQELTTHSEPAVLAASLTTSEISWDGSDLVVSVVATVHEPDAPVRALLILHQLGTHLTFLLEPVHSGPTAADLGRECQCEFRFDPLTAALGQPLSTGLWELEVMVGGATRMSAPMPIRASRPLCCALLPGLTVTFGRSSGGALQLDVGPTRHPLIRKADASDAAVRETAAGSVLHLRLPSARMQTDRSLEGRIGLDRLLFPARIERTAEAPVLVAHVSGVPGTVSISTLFGRAALQPTGLALAVAADGQMAVVEAAPTPPASTSQRPAFGVDNENRAAAGATSGLPEQEQAATGAVAKIRRALPHTLEPVAKRLRRNKTARAMYRRLTGLHH